MSQTVYRAAKNVCSVMEIDYWVSLDSLPNSLVHVIQPHGFTGNETPNARLGASHLAVRWRLTQQIPFVQTHKFKYSIFGNINNF
ncbi:hypothetical protein WN55_04021 [Dufourea novaeangliae]|uniref:Uncharacterized protein n=1 Tax=Dufourea novaeangliae TaxID=178035 RepID=A0A154PKY2_DUFNO|nr:hypothetical protein WN55_04021 [Dufourea novaeangliae]